MISALAHRRLQLTPLEDGVLKEIYKKFLSKFTLDTCVFRSDIAGAGKTHAVKRKASKY